jgi:hypothetical protein
VPANTVFNGMHDPGKWFRHPGEVMPHLFRSLAVMSYPKVCMNARWAADAIKSRRIKSDKGDAWAFAEIDDVVQADGFGGDTVLPRHGGLLERWVDRVDAQAPRAVGMTILGDVGGARSPERSGQARTTLVARTRSPWAFSPATRSRNMARLVVMMRRIPDPERKGNGEKIKRLIVRQ